MTEAERLVRRLDEWKREKMTNKNGMAHLADRAIALIERDLRDLQKDCRKSKPSN